MVLFCRGSYGQSGGRGIIGVEPEMQGWNCRLLVWAFSMLWVGPIRVSLAEYYEICWGRQISSPDDETSHARDTTPITACFLTGACIIKGWGFIIRGRRVGKPLKFNCLEHKSNGMPKACIGKKRSPKPLSTIQDLAPIAVGLAAPSQQCAAALLGSPEEVTVSKN